MKKLLVTAALPYSNGRLHVGHIAGCYLPADIYVRYQRLIGREVKFVCGSDDHGVAIVLTSEKEGRTPQETARHYHDLQEADFRGLGISFDTFSSTSQNPCHAPRSQDFFLRLHEQGFFEKHSSRQFYDEEREMFLPDRFVTGTCSFCGAVDQNGDQCENCGKVLDVDTLRDAVSVVSGEPATVRETVHWFLDLGRFEEKVEQWFQSAFLRDQTRAFLRGLLGSGLVKRSMTRDLSWGIPVPLKEKDAEGKVLYVWFDAPIGYISNTEELLGSGEAGESFEQWWKSDDAEILHFIGEDNTIFHCLIWIAMLSAEGSYQLPAGVVVNQFLNIQFQDEEEEQKISKSRGTAVWIGDYLEEGGDPDVLRYYLTTIAPEKARTVYKPEDLLQKNNADLANTLGNFVNRVVSFSRKYYGPEVPACDDASFDDIDQAFAAHRERVGAAVSAKLDAHEYRAALEEVMEFARAGNRYIDEKAPWKTRKEDEATTKRTLVLCMRAIHTIAVLLQPFLPQKSGEMLALLWPEQASGEGRVEKPWSEQLNAPPSGSPLGEPVILFQKKELNAE
ncbi:methionine--tRNA ligase [bacterium]|nr:methionine--tRNA ligase [bacterium]